MACKSTSTKTSDGTCHSLHCSQGNLPTSVELRTMHRVAIHGARLNNRVSANAVGRRGPFPEGRFTPDTKRSPLREMTERGRACAVPKAGVGVQGQGQPAASDDRRLRPGQRQLTATAAEIRDRGGDGRLRRP